MHQSAQRQLHDLNYLFFEITRRCNLACRHCGSDCAADVSQPDLPADSILAVLDGIRQRHDPARITVALTGGEPLLYPGFFELGTAITARGYPWGMVSNGWAWTPARVEAARLAGLRTMTISLDGPEAVHDWLRGRAGSCERACAALRLLASAPWLQKLDVVTCAPPQPRPARRDAQPAGVAGRRTLAAVHRLAHRKGGLRSGPAARQGWFSTAAVLGRGGARRPGPVVAYSESGYLGACDTTVRGHPFFCRAGINVAGVMADGAILACPNIDRSFAQGNINTDDLCDVWESGYRIFRDRSWLRTGECADCSEWSLCQGNSFHLLDPQTGHTRLCYHRSFDLAERPERA
ncbi:MAG: radical SAM protein [bacterium]|nr:radical SAM protein [bacterium]